QGLVARLIREQVEGSEILALSVNTARVHNARTFLAAAEAILAVQKSERCLTAAEGIGQLQAELAGLLGTLGERTDAESRLAGRGGQPPEPGEPGASATGAGEPQDEARLAAAARVLAPH